jgi:hypothetical protein
VDAEAIQRYARHISLPEIGLAGQERLVASRVVVAGDDLAAEVAARYLRAAGVGAVRVVGADGDPWPLNGAAWLAALEDAAPHLVVRSGFDDDAMLGTLKRLGVPSVVVRSQENVVDLLSLPGRAVPDAPLDTPVQRATRTKDGSAGVVAGTLAAAEALRVLLAREPEAHARHLRLPLDGGAPRVQEIPWG